MDFKLTVYVVLVFLVPGSIALGAVILWSTRAVCLLGRFLADPTTGFALLLLSVSFVLGALVDSIRTVLLDPITKNLASIKTPPDYLAKLHENNVRVFQVLLERTEEYYRLNANTTLAVLVLGVSLVLTKGFSCVILLLGFLLGLMFIASVEAKSASNWAMVQFKLSTE